MGINERSTIRSERGVELDLTFFQSQGPWAFLFVILLFYVLKENAKREERLINCLDELSTKYDIISHDVVEIKDMVKGK